MAFKRKQEPRTLELTSLIDIVFLLLIFFLVSFAFSISGDASNATAYPDLDLPSAIDEPPALTTDVLQNLMIQIVPDTARARYARTVYVLWPSFSDTVVVTRSRALRTALHDSTFASFESGFLQLNDDGFQRQPASRLIAKSIARYARTSRRSVRRRPIVEIRAEANTEFRIVNFIMEECGRHKEIAPEMIIRTAL